VVVGEEGARLLGGALLDVAARDCRGWPDVVVRVGATVNVAPGAGHDGIGDGDGGNVI
jgi:hypothetical protein